MKTVLQCCIILFIISCTVKAQDSTNNEKNRYGAYLSKEDINSTGKNLF